MTDRTQIGLLGAGRQAAETAEAAAATADVVFAAVQSSFLTPGDSSVRLVDIATRDTALTARPVTVAVGPPLVRRLLVELWSGTTYHSVVSGSAMVSPSARIGAGVTVSPAAVLSTAVELGDHSHVNIAASLSHDVKVGPFSVVAPGARLAGGVTVGAGVFIGAGAVVLGGVSLGDGSVVGAGAVVVSDTVPLGVYVGAPARLSRTRKDWLDAI